MTTCGRRRRRREQVGDPCKPYQLCVKCDGIKMLSHPGVVRLRRYMNSKARVRVLLRAKLLRALRQTAPVRAFCAGLLPLRAQEWMRRIEARLTRLLRPQRDVTPPVGQRAQQFDFSPEQAPLFVSDLTKDPLEKRPRRVDPARLSGPYRELLDRLKEY